MSFFLRYWKYKESEEDGIGGEGNMKDMGMATDKVEGNGKVKGLSRGMGKGEKVEGRGGFEFNKIIFIPHS